MNAICPLRAPVPTGKADPKADLAAYDAQVAEMRDEFAQTPANPADPGWVKTKLAHMVEVDQYMRHATDLPHEHGYTPEQTKEFWDAMGPRWKEVDESNTRDLKGLLQQHNWFTISQWGPQADNNAWLLVQHADGDRPFQKDVLKRLEGLYPQGETRPNHYAYLFDRVATSFSDPSQREPQRFGTQGRCTGAGTWEPWPCEDPARLDERRASVRLEPEAAYIARFKDICH